MSLSEKRPGLSLDYHDEFAANDSSLIPRSDRTVCTKIQATMLYPNDKVCKVDFDFDHEQGDSRLACMAMDDWGAELIADAYRYRYGEAAAQALLAHWHKQYPETGRKPGFLFIRKPEQFMRTAPEVEVVPAEEVGQSTGAADTPEVITACGRKGHDSDKMEQPEVITACGRKGHDSDKMEQPEVITACGRKGHDSDKMGQPEVITACGRKGHDSDKMEQPEVITACGRKGHDSDKMEQPEVITACGRKGHDSDKMEQPEVITACGRKGHDSDKMEQPDLAQATG